MSEITESVKESESFSQRLQLALRNAGVPPSPSRVAYVFNRFSKKWSVTPHAARKWIKGQAIPSQDRLCVLADMLGVAPDWLRFGEKSSPYIPPSVNANTIQMNALFEQFDERQQQQIIALLQSLTTFRGESTPDN